jgi:hypothetical protein
MPFNFCKSMKLVWFSTNFICFNVLLKDIILEDSGQVGVERLNGTLIWFGGFLFKNYQDLLGSCSLFPPTTRLLFTHPVIKPVSSSFSVFSVGPAKMLFC